MWGRAQPNPKPVVIGLSTLAKNKANCDRPQRFTPAANYPPQSRHRPPYFLHHLPSCLLRSHSFSPLPSLDPSACNAAHFREMRLEFIISTRSCGRKQRPITTCLDKHDPHQEDKQGSISSQLHFQLCSVIQVLG